MTGRTRLDPAATSAMAGAAVIGAQFIAGKATRDAFFLSHFEPTALPPMIIGTALFAVALVGAGSTTLARISPRRYVPAAFAANAALLFAVWGLTAASPRLAATLLYLLISGAGPMLGSGFWLIASERFDPRTAKKRFGQIGAAGTLGGLLGGILAARVSASAGIAAVILLLAALNIVCAWQARSWAHQSDHEGHADEGAALPAGSGLRLLTEQHNLRNVALVMLLATIAAAFIDYVFKVQVTAGFAAGPELARFFSLYYASVSLISFAVQAFASRSILERLGLSAAMSAVPLSVVAGTTASLVNPALSTLIVARGVEAVLHGSLLRAGYEVFYTPIPTGEKRAVKAVVDVGTDRLGDIVAAAAIQVLLWTALDGQTAMLLGLAALCAVVALILTHNVNRGYVAALERSLRNRAVEIDLADAVDRQTRTVIGRLSHHHGRQTGSALRATAAGGDTMSVSTELELRDIRQLRSRDPAAVRHVLGRDDLLAPALVPYAVKLLEWDAVAADAVRALRSVAELHVGELVDVLTDPAQPFAVRRRLARVFSVCSSQRAVDGLLLGLDDLRFEVRVQCGRSLSAIVERNPRVRIDAAQVSAVVLREVAVSRRVWESRRLVDDAMTAGEERSGLDALVGERANRALAHVFTLLELILPADQLRIAYRCLHTSDTRLQGTALEYLDQVLPREIRDRLWPFLEAGPPSDGPRRSREEILEDLFRSQGYR